MYKVEAKTILSGKNGLNIYRGCTHGCIYCDARSDCYGMEHPFEDIAVKANAPVLLRKALGSKRRLCMVGTGAMSDPYLPAEAELELTKECLEIIAQYGFGVTLITKSDLVLRDLPILKEINSQAKAVVQMTLTTFDDELCRKIEPQAPVTSRRFEVLEILRDNGIPTVVWLCPILPFINDTAANIRGILDYCLKAQVYGVICFGMGLTLRSGNREYFYNRLDALFPGLKERYISLYGDKYEIVSPKHSYLMSLFTDTCRANGLVCDNNAIFAYLNALPNMSEPVLFPEY